MNKKKIIFLFATSVTFFFLGFSSVWIQRGVGRIVSKQPQARAIASSPTKTQEVEHFKSLFGEKLQLRFTHDNQLISIHGKLSESKKDLNFKNYDVRSVLDRAHFVLENIKPFLVYNPGYPLDTGKVEFGENTAQVVFQQKLDGAFFEPTGKVSIHFGENGEVISVLSDYIRSLNILNQYKLNAAQAKSNLTKNLPHPASNQKITGGKRVIWISGTEGYRAFEFIKGKSKYIVHGESGRILFTK